MSFFLLRRETRVFFCLQGSDRNLLHHLGVGGGGEGFSFTLGPKPKTPIFSHLFFSF